MWDFQGAVLTLAVADPLLSGNGIVVTSIAEPLGTTAAAEECDGAAVHTLPINEFCPVALLADV